MERWYYSLMAKVPGTAWAAAGGALFGAMVVALILTDPTTPAYGAEWTVRAPVMALTLMLPAAASAAVFAATARFPVQPHTSNGGKYLLVLAATAGVTAAVTAVTAVSSDPGDSVLLMTLTTAAVGSAVGALAGAVRDMRERNRLELAAVAGTDPS